MGFFDPCRTGGAAPCMRGHAWGVDSILMFDEVSYMVKFNIDNWEGLNVDVKITQVG